VRQLEPMGEANSCGRCLGVEMQSRRRA
jgi:hypothetical protein